MTPDDTTSAHSDHPPIAGGRTPPPADKHASEKYAFISYKREDEGRVEPIVKELRAKGIPVWWDRDIPIGKDWPVEIKRHLKEAQVVVAVWSEKSVGDEGAMVQEEARAALNPRRLVPIAIDRVEPPFGFGGVQAIDLSKWKKRDTDPAFVKFVTQVAEQLDTILPPLKVVTPFARLVRRLALPVLAGSVVLAASVWGLYAILAEPTAEQLYGRLANRDGSKNEERAKAINTLLARQQRSDSARLPDNYRQVIRFLAWRAKRPALIECDASPSTLHAAQLLDAPDVAAAVTYLRTSRRMQVPTGTLSLDSVNLQSHDFTGADLRHTSFKAACLDKAKFPDARLVGSVFDSAHLSRASFVRARVDSAQFGMSQLDGTVWFNACLRYANFAGANLKDADLHRATITWANFSDAHGRVQSGWGVVDATGPSNALFVGAKDILPDEREFLQRNGASFTADFDEWNVRRGASAVDTLGRACRPPV